MKEESLKNDATLGVPESNKNSKSGNIAPDQQPKGDPKELKGTNTEEGKEEGIEREDRSFPESGTLEEVGQGLGKDIKSGDSSMVLRIENGNLIMEKVKLEWYKDIVEQESAVEEGIQYSKLNDGSYLVTIWPASEHYKETTGIVERLENGEKIKLDELSDTLKGVLLIPKEELEEKIRKKNEKEVYQSFTQPLNQRKGKLKTSNVAHAPEQQQRRPSMAPRG